MPGQFEKSAVRMGGPWGGPLAAKKKRAAEGTTVEAGCPMWMGSIHALGALVRTSFLGARRTAAYISTLFSKLL